MPSTWNYYLRGRLVLSILDIVTDTVQAASLLVLGFVTWGVLTIVFPIMGLIAAMVAVIAHQYHDRKGGSHADMSPRQFLYQTLQALATLYEGLVESGPELILQMTILLHGVHIEDLLILGDPEHRWSSLQWFSGILHICSIVSSFSSLLVTMMYFNEQRLDCACAWGVVRFCVAVACNVLCIVYRVFVASVMFSVSPAVASVVGMVLYALNVVGYFLAGQTLEMSFLSGYACIFSPFGCSKSHILGNSMLQEVVNEEERRRVERKREVRLAKRSHCLFAVTSLMLLAPYYVLVHLLGFQESLEDHLGRFVPEVVDARVLLVTPAVMLLAAAICSLMFVRSLQMSKSPGVKVQEGAEAAVDLLGEEHAKVRPIVKTPQ